MGFPSWYFLWKPAISIAHNFTNNYTGLDMKLKINYITIGVKCIYRMVPIPVG